MTTQSAAKVAPLADRVVVKPLEDTEQMRGGLYIPDTAKEKPQQGAVVAVGPGRFEKETRVPMDVMVTFLGDDLRSDALRLASELRAERLRVELFPDGSRKLDKSLKYASSRNVPMLVILGEDERARGEVTVRDLQTRQQQAAPRATAARDIARRIRIEAT